LFNHAKLLSLPIDAVSWLVVPPAVAVRSDIADPEMAAGWDALERRCFDPDHVRSLRELCARLHAEVESGTLSVKKAAVRFGSARKNLVMQGCQHGAE